MADLPTYGRTNRPLDPLYTYGKQLKKVYARPDFTSEIAADDILILAEGLTVDTRIHRLLMPNGHLSIPSASAVTFGFYRRETEDRNSPLVAVDADALLTVDMSSSRDACDLLTHTTPADANAVAAEYEDRLKTIGELLTTSSQAYQSDFTVSGGFVLGAVLGTVVNFPTYRWDMDIEFEVPTIR